MSNSSFAVDTKKVFNGIVIAVVAGIVAAILQPIVWAGSLFGAVASALGASAMGGYFSTLGTVGVVWFIFTLLVIVGYVLVFLGLNGFQKKLSGNEAKNANYLKIAYILAIVGAAVSLFHILGWLVWIFNVAAFVLTTLGYYGLKNGNFNEPVKKAFNLLFISQIILVAAIVVGLIPFTGVLVAIAKIAAFILLLLGWYKVKANS